MIFCPSRRWLIFWLLWTKNLISLSISKPKHLRWSHSLWASIDITSFFDFVFNLSSLSYVPSEYLFLFAFFTRGDHVIAFRSWERFRFVEPESNHFVFTIFHSVEIGVEYGGTLRGGVRGWWRANKVDKSPMVVWIDCYPCTRQTRLESDFWQIFINTYFMVCIVLSRLY